MYEENQLCVNRCEVVNFENRCYNGCPQTDKFMYNGTCLRSCPSNASKIDEQHHEPNNFFICMENCPSEKFILETIVYPIAPTANDSQLMVNVWHAMKSENMTMDQNVLIYVRIFITSIAVLIIVLNNLKYSTKHAFAIAPK